MAKGDDIQTTLMDFAGKAMDICDRLPETTAGKHVADQLLRSATSAAANYAEARGAESRNDFVHKLGLVFKELNESEVWLTLIMNRGMLAGDSVGLVLGDCTVLCRIIAVSRRTALGTRSGHGPPRRGQASL